MREQVEKILCFDIDAANMRLIRFLFGNNYDVVDVGECFTDILAIGAAAIIINPNKVSKDMFEALNAVFGDDDHTMVIFTSEPMKTVKFRYHVVDLEEDCDIKLVLIQKHLRQRRQVLNEWNWKKQRNLLDKVIIVDEEVSGWDKYQDELICLNAAYLEDNVVKDRIKVYIKPEKPITSEIEEITHITNEQLVNGVDIESALREIYNLCPMAPWLIFNEEFVYPFYMKAKNKARLDVDFELYDIRTMFTNVYPNIMLKRITDLNGVVEAEDNVNDLDVMIKMFDKIYCDV